jgi:methylmalonyl-CoA mutase
VFEPIYGPLDVPAATLPTRALTWDVRAPVAHPDPATANALALEALEGGAESVLLRVAPQGPDGCILRAPADLGRTLDGVVLEAAAVALDAGFAGPRAADQLAALAKGSPAARLEFHMDPLGAFARAGSSPGPLEAHLALAARTAARLAPAYPEAGLVLADGRLAHEAGGSPAQELGVMAAAALAYLKALTAAGMSTPAALGGIVLGLAADQDVLAAIAKLRAARLIWARIAAACGAPDIPARIEARSSGRMLTRAEPFANLDRLTAAGFAAAVGGADAVVLAPFTEALGRPDARAHRLSRNIGLILKHEAGLEGAEDPAAGAWALEALTDRLARDGWAAMQAIEATGGLLATLTSGSIAAEIAAVRAARAQALSEGRATIVGAAAFAGPAAAALEVEPHGPPPAKDASLCLPGPDSACPPLTPWRLAEAFEAAA